MTKAVWLVRDYANSEIKQLVSHGQRPLRSFHSSWKTDKFMAYWICFSKTIFNALIYMLLPSELLELLEKKKYLIELCLLISYNMASSESQW